jgi:hypothetical protein
LHRRSLLPEGKEIWENASGPESSFPEAFCPFRREIFPGAVYASSEQKHFKDLIKKESLFSYMIIITGLY